MAAVTTFNVIIRVHGSVRQVTFGGIRAQDCATVVHAAFVVWILAGNPSIFHLFVRGLVIYDELEVVECKICNGQEHQKRVSCDSDADLPLPESLHEVVAFIMGDYDQIDAQAE
eukprot:CAMPEP_0185252708 /NCGR_PEP_ID=MMETSP1359-20130426/1714_1 /TAXON_ID=552665 /ORGANISM="Bigelowiella longifila, Strain CCMP242" /LENGTH=113 /DNA_ID=CAMNT_0027834945 /DNA_START=252 /DNA_END=593 /DNA_ORIENTATION=+